MRNRRSVIVLLALLGAGCGDLPEEGYLQGMEAAPAQAPVPPPMPNPEPSVAASAAPVAADPLRLRHFVQRACAPSSVPGLRLKVHFDFGQNQWVYKTVEL